MKVFYKIILFISAFFIISCSCYANQTRVIIAPLNLPTSGSVTGIYPNVSDFIANDIINDLNKNLLFDALDLNSTEKLMMSHGLWRTYRDFLKDYKEKGIIDYKTCDLLFEKLGIHKIILVSSGFSMQNMMFKRPFLYKIGITEVEPIQSFYRMDISLAMIDTQSCLIDFERSYKQYFRANNFEVMSNSINDNAFSTDQIKAFSDEIAEEISTEVFIKTAQSAHRNVKSNIVSTSNRKVISRDGSKTKNGHFSVKNDEYLKNKRKESFKEWIKERTYF